MSRILHATRRRAEVQCPNCDTVHKVDIDDLGAELETIGCSADDCTERLCSACPAFCCCGCGLKHCLGHRTILAGEPLCPVCVVSARVDWNAEAVNG